jgi:hypothetical protein
LAAKLKARFVQEPEAVQPTGGQLPASCVQRQLPVESDALATVEERSRLAPAAEPKRLQPLQCDEAETVIELSYINVART